MISLTGIFYTLRLLLKNNFTMNLSNQSVISLLDDSISCVPAAEKAAYYEAVEKAPNLVLDETDPIDFLRIVEFNAWDAVKRLSNYWRWKKKLFAERWLLPIHDISGSGALDSKDLNLLWTGYIVNLPPDNEGNSVILFDRSRLIQGWDSLDPARNLRLFFYTVAVAAKNQKLSQNPTDSYVALNLIDSLPNPKHSKDDVSDVLSNTSPIKLNSIHSMILTKQNKSALFTRFVVPFVCRNMQYMFGRSIRTYSLVFSIENARLTLEGHGLNSERFPPSLGGSWDYASFYENLEIQTTKPTSSSIACDLERTVAHVSTTSLENCSSVTSVAMTRNGDHKNISTSTFSEFGKNATFSKDAVINRLDGVSMSSAANSEVRIVPILSNIIADRKRKANMGFDYSEDIIIDSCLNLNFVLYNNYDATKAADHLMTYISMRRSLFGIRSGLPMIQTMGGSLNEEDVVTLTTGFLMMLPRDKRGNFVLMLEPYKAAGCSAGSIRRCYFYILSILCEEKFTETKTVTILAFMDDHQRCDTTSILTFVDINNVFPLDFSFIHCFLDPSGLPLTSSSKSGAEEFLTKLFQPWKGQILIHTLSNDTSKSFFISHDLDMLSLPSRIGGTWTMSSFQQWQKERHAIENLKSDKITSLDVGTFVSKDQLVASKDCLIRETISKTNEQRFITNITYQKTTKKRGQVGSNIRETSFRSNPEQSGTSPHSIGCLVPVVEDIPGNNTVELGDDFSCSMSIFEGDLDDMSSYQLDPFTEVTSFDSALATFN